MGEGLLPCYFFCVANSGKMLGHTPKLWGSGLLANLFSKVYTCVKLIILLVCHLN